MTQHVVIVDDEEMTLQQLTGIATELRDVIAHPFSSSREALAWREGNDVDCFVLDYHMAPPDGLETARLIRAQDPFVPIVIVTAEDEREVRNRAFDLGVNDFAVKPIDHREVRARLSTLLALRAAQRQATLYVQALEGSLREVEAASRKHAERLETLWQIANNPSLHDEELLFAMLRQGAAAILPGQTFRGWLSRIEGTHAVLEAFAELDHDGSRGARVLETGLREEIVNTIVAPLLQTRGAQSWDDVVTSPQLPEAVRTRGWRAMIATHFRAGRSTYALTFGSPEPASRPFGAQDHAYIEVLATLFANQLRVGELEHSLRDSEERSRQHAERLETLWGIVNNPNLRDEELWLAMLRQAATVIRPDQLFHGMLARVAGDDIVVEAFTPAASGPGRDELLGRVIPLAHTVVAKTLEGPRATQSWDDLESEDTQGTIGRARGMRSLIATSFTAGGTSYILSFASAQPANKSFGPQEHAYVDVLASFFASHLQQRWQSDRIQYQQSHDVLTGLLNRSQFRSQARLAAAQRRRFGIVLIDIDRFREVNETHGNMIGDAVLVEVATALRGRASAEEIVGRIGANAFAIYVPSPGSKATLHRRAVHFAEAFARPFSTGDRAGKDFIALTASVAAAGAPQDGSDVETIFSRADVALLAAKQRGRGTLLLYGTALARPEPPAHSA